MNVPGMRGGGARPPDRGSRRLLKSKRTWLVVLTAALGIWMGTIGVVGHYSGPIPVVTRILFAVAGLLLLIPSDAFRGAGITDIGGLALGGALLWREMRRKAA